MDIVQNYQLVNSDIIFSIFSSEKHQSTDLSATLSAIFSSYSDSEAEEEEEDSICQSINSETHCAFSYKDICLEHVEVEANGTAVATAAEPENNTATAEYSICHGPVMAAAVEPEIQPQQQIVQSCTSTLGIPDAPVTTDENSTE